MIKIKATQGNMLALTEMITAIITIFLYLLFVDFSSERFVLIVLPFGFLIILLLFYNSQIRNRSFICMILRVLAFLRMVILPLLWIKNIDMQLMASGVRLSNHYGIASLLMIYEYLCVESVILLTYNHIPLQNQENMNEPNTQYNNIFYRLLIIILLGFAVALYLVIPEIRLSYKSIFSIRMVEFTQDTSVEFTGGTIKRMLGTLFALDVQILRILLPSSMLYSKYRQGKHTHMVFYMFLLLCFGQFLFLSSTFAEALVADIVVGYFFLTLYPKYRKKSLIILFTFSAGGALLFFVLRFMVTGGGYLSRTNGFIYYISQVTNAYFQGIDNVSATLNIPSGYEIEGVVASIIKAIPFNNTIFSGNNLQRLSVYYNLYNFSKGQIVPTIGVGYYCLDFFFAPVFSIAFVYLALRYERKAMNNLYDIKFVPYFFCSVVFALGVGAKSPSITLRWFVSWGVFLLLITLFSERRRRKVTP